MAQIVKYTAQQGLNPGSAPSTNLQSYTGAALQNVGGAVQNLADVIGRRDQQKEDFQAADGAKRLELQLGQAMEERALTMPEDGAGFHDSFLRDVYTPAREKFLSGLTPRLREKYETLLGDEGSVTEAWSIKAATREKDQLFNWYDSTLNTSKEQLATAIAVDPDGYDALLQQGFEQIDASGLPPAKKMEHRRQWEEMAQIAHLNTMLERNPEAVLKELGADPRMLSPTTQFSALKAALIQQESGGDPNALSPKGAIGMMQVMPATGAEIAKELGDEKFPTGGDETAIRAYLSNPVTNQRYGEHYLKKQIRAFARTGGLEAALIAYNGGPERAKKWIASGFDDSVLPAETRKYYKAIMSQLPDLPGRGVAVQGDPSKVRLEFKQGKGMAALVRGEQEANVNPDLTNRVKTSFAALGIDRVRINSGYRSAAQNEAAGGAKRSQHMHGNAMDIDVSGYSHAERVKIIEALSANGITGLGIGANIIHADLGGRRAWGYATSAGGGEVPSWAREAINKHLSETNAVPSGRIGAGRYATLPYNRRQQFIASADQELTRRYNEQSKASAVQKVEMRTAIQNELASLNTTGQSTGLVDDTGVATILGEDDYIKFVRDRETALRTFTATEGIDNMTLEEMDARLADYQPEPGSPTFADDQKVAAAVQRKINDAISERSRSPDKAALRDPAIKGLWDQISVDPNAKPEDVQTFVRLMLEKQKEFNLKPGSEAPVPREWAMQIGQSLSRIPELGGSNMAEVNAAILVQYDALHKVFGEYTDEVILHALTTYRGVGTNTAEILTAYMEGIAAGGDPLARVRQQLDTAMDRDQVESTADRSWFGSIRDFFAGERADDEAAAAEPEVSPELVLRARTAITAYDDDLTPADMEALVARYGRAAVDAAMLQLGNN